MCRLGRVTAPEDRLARYRLHAEVCRVLTDPKRLMLIDALRAGERSVGELAGVVGIGLPNASQHLAILRGAGLVVGRHVGTSVVYRLAEPSIVDACDVIDGIVGRRIASRASGAAGAPGPAADTGRRPKHSSVAGSPAAAGTRVPRIPRPTIQPTNGAPR